LPRGLFDESDYYSGYFYKLLPYDHFGTGALLSIDTGIRLSRNLSTIDIPSGFRTLVDDSKAVGTNIQGDVITNTYLSWKKDKGFGVEQYEVVIEDQVEKESYVSSVTVPQVSGINYLISGTGSGRADFDKDSLIKLSPENLQRTIFDVFQPYSTAGVQWAAHTVYLDSDYLDNLPGASSIIDKQFVEIPAGNTTSGYVYFTGVGRHQGQDMSYAAADTFLQAGDQSEPHALVARNTNNEVIVEYEPRIKVPTKKDGSYSFKVRAVNGLGQKSLYAETQTFTASGAKSHFRFNPIDTNLELGGTGTITSSGPFVTTVGGKNITAVGTGVVVIGGIDNRATGELSALVGGSGNRLMGAAGPPAEASFMGGGRLNVISGHRSVLVGGEGNLISGDAQALLGGQYNTIFGGPETSYHESSSIDFEHSIIGGGTLNVISGDRSFIGGGNRNTIGVNVARSSLTYGLDINSSSWSKFANYSIINSAIVGGKENELYSSYSFIGGGYGNKAYEGNGPTKAFGNAIVGGRDNVISGDETAGTVVLGGRYNEGRAPYTVVGGYKSTGAGWYGVALGAYAASAHDGAMVLADGTTPSIEDGSIAKKSHGEHTLNLFFENGAYLRNGSLYISGDLHVSGAADFAGGGAAIDGVGVAGYIASWTDANTIQTGGLYNLAGGNVGIGTTAPQAALQVNGDVGITGETRISGNLLLGANEASASNNPNNFSTPVLNVRGGNDSQGSAIYVGNTIDNNSLVLGQWGVHSYVMNRAAGPLRLYTNATEVARFDSAGSGPGSAHFGIGDFRAADPQALLTVSGDASITGSLKIGAGSTITDFNSAERPLAIRSDSAGIAIGLMEPAGGTEQWAIGVDAAGDLNFHDSTAAAIRVTFQDGGDVGIGTETPATSLHVYGATNESARFESTDNDVYITLKDDTDQCFIYHDASKDIMLLGFDDTSSDPTIDLVIHADGKVGIGTTAPTGRMHIYQSGDSQPAFLVEGSQGSLFSVEDSLTGSLMSVNDIAGLPVFEAFDDGTIVMGQYNSGDFIVTGNSVGIGTANPSQKLQVVGQVNVTDATTSSYGTIIFGDSISRYIRGNSAELQVGSTINQLHFQKTDGAGQIASSAADGTTAIQILARISHSSDSNVFEVINGAGTDPLFEVAPNRIRLRDHAYVSGNLYVSGAIISADDAVNDHVSGLSGYFGKVGIGTTKMGTNVNGVEARVVISGGSVGIGTDTPDTGYSLHIANTLGSHRPNGASGRN